MLTDTLSNAPSTAPQGLSESSRWRVACWGAFLLLLGIFLFGHPGRIDIIDGQYRFDVSNNLVNLNGPVLTDYWLTQIPAPTNPETGKLYSYYTAPASLTPIPLMILSRAINGANGRADRFAFSLTSALFGALIGPLLLAFYRRLGVALLPALGWTFVFALATLWWPSSETVFDQCQHGVVVLAMVLCAYDATKRGGMGLALAAGLLGGLLFNYRTPFLALLPVIPIYWWFERRRGTSTPSVAKSVVISQVLLFAVGVAVGFAGYLYYNWARFGQLGMPAFGTPTSAIGNPVSGFLALTVSPGKGILWFSPPIILAAFGLPKLLKSHRGLAWMIIALTVLQFGEMSFLTYAGGDWCWGPRYLIPVMPLLALAFPFATFKTAKKSIVGVLTGLGIAVQLLGLSTDTSRFFWARHLSGFFWVNSWSYFQISQLTSRPSEIWQSWTERDRVRPLFNSNPTDDPTYFSMASGKYQAVTVKDKAGSHVVWERVDTRKWEQQFRMLYLPRPWWGWMWQVPSKQRPVNPSSFLFLCTLVTGTGALMVWGAAKQSIGRATGVESAGAIEGSNAT